MVQKRETKAINKLCVREILSLSFVCGAYFFEFRGRNLVCFVVAYNFNGKYAPEARKTSMRTAFFTRAALVRPRLNGLLPFESAIEQTKETMPLSHKTITAAAMKEFQLTGAATLLQNSETLVVSQANSVGFEHFSYVNTFFCSDEFVCLLDI